MTHTRQSLFDTALNGIRTQGGPSMDENGDCLYRGPGGHRCGVGHILLDEHYDHSLEGCQAAQDPLRDPLILSGVDPIDMHFIVQLQNAHDQATIQNGRPLLDNTEFLANFEQGMAALAVNHGLNYAPPP